MRRGVLGSKLSSSVWLAVIIGMSGFCEPGESGEAHFGAERIDVTCPTKGAFFWATTDKIQEGETQWVSFTFDTGDVFEKNPNAHLHIRLDANNVAGDKPLRGRGITIGDIRPASPCDQVAFEQFGEANTHPGDCGIIGLANDVEYDASIHASIGWVSYKIWAVDYIYSSSSVTGYLERQRTLVSSAATPMPNRLDDSEISGIAFGMAGDFNGGRFAISNVRYGVFW